jgi:acetyl esterase/lipase
LVKNVAALGWGWYYSNIAILSHLGVRVDGASAVGAENAQDVPIDIEQVRAYMNLAEDPMFSSMTAFANADVALDIVFDVVPSAVSTRLASPKSPSNVPLTIPALPVCARLMSCLPRPVNRTVLSNLGKHWRRDVGLTPQTLHTQPNVDHAANGTSGAKTEPLCESLENVPHPQCQPGLLTPAATSSTPSIGRSESGTPQSPHRLHSEPSISAIAPNRDSSAFAVFGGIVKQLQSRATAAASAMTVGSRHASGREVEEVSFVHAFPARLQDAMHVSEANAIPDVQARNQLGGNFAVSLAEAAADPSSLRGAIKNEFVKLQSNVSFFLGQSSGDVASGLIVHYHGGGFVSQSSAGHSSYLKQWASDIQDAVILCVDYKLAPEFPYPTALDECAYVYQWALENSELLGTSAERVVLCGDSAGGNLAVAVALKCQAADLRRPDGICLAYPALYVNVAWSPSRLLSFFDPLLPLSILDLCLRAYVPNGELSFENPLISPMIASAKTLIALPPIAIVCGSVDPLLDDSVQFAHNLAKCGRTCDTLRVFDSLPHGFMNMYHLSNDARTAVQCLGEQIAGFLRTDFQITGENMAAGAVELGSSVSSSPHPISAQEATTES